MRAKIARRFTHYLGEQRYETESIGIADDLSDADGLVVLTFDQAQAKARQRMVERAHGAAGLGDVPTVREAIEDYVAGRNKRESERQGRPLRSDADTRLARHVLASALAETALSELREEALLDWRAGLPETLRGSTRQRLTNDLRAALNAAYARHRRRLGPDFPATVRFGLKAPKTGDEREPTARANQILSDAEVGALIAAAREVDAAQEWDGDLFRMVLLLAATGALFGQLRRMLVRDVQRSNRRVMVPPSRKGQGHKTESIPVPVGGDVFDALLPAVTGRGSAEPLLERWRHVQVPGEALLRWHRHSRGPWSSSAELTRPWEAVRRRAGMPTVIPYALRHSSIVRGIRANLPLRLVAATHDTSTAMIEQHYSRWITDGLEAMARAAVVPLVPAGEDKVTPCGGRPEITKFRYYSTAPVAAFLGASCPRVCRGQGATFLARKVTHGTRSINARRRRARPEHQGILPTQRHLQEHLPEESPGGPRSPRGAAEPQPRWDHARSGARLASCPRGRGGRGGASWLSRSRRTRRRCRFRSGARAACPPASTRTRDLRRS